MRNWVRPIFRSVTFLNNKRPRDILRSCFPEAGKEGRLFEMADLVDLKIDPKELGSVSKLMAKKSFDAYRKTGLFSIPVELTLPLVPRNSTTVP